MKKVVLIISSTLLALTARSNSIVFSDLGPGDTYDSVAINSVVNNGVVSEEVAAQFTAGVSGTLATVDLGLTYTRTAGPVNVYLYGDAAGSPNNSNQTFLGSGTPSALSGTTDNSLVSFAVAGTVPVTMGTTYWLVLKPPSANTFDNWNSTSPAVTGKVTFSINDTTWIGGAQPLTAFRITATSAGAVPDSGSTILLLFGSGTATLGLDLLLRRRSQACN